MDEREIQNKRRDNEEQATRERAKILGLTYVDAREFEDTVPLVKGLLDVEQMHKDSILPLSMGGDEKHYQFLVTS